MFDPDQNAATPPASSAFEDLTVLLRLIGDDKRYQKRLDALMAADVKANEAKVGAERAQAALAAAKAEHDAACAERQAEAEAVYKHAAERLADADAKEARLQAIAKDIREDENRFKRELMRFGGLDHNHNDRLQSLPSYGALAAELLEQPAPVDDGGSAARDELESIPVENIVAKSTLARSGSRTMRRQ
jgi:hypothetical protein